MKHFWNGWQSASATSILICSQSGNVAARDCGPGILNAAGNGFPSGTHYLNGVATPNAVDCLNAVDLPTANVTRSVAATPSGTRCGSHSGIRYPSVAGTSTGFLNGWQRARPSDFGIYSGWPCGPATYFDWLNGHGFYFLNDFPTSTGVD